ncbi:MAG: FecR domain-containing protein [Kiritimatiellae bacterium]|nr:FecR domain-containing protein [Kiritimatiellia bacterium]
MTDAGTFEDPRRFGRERAVEGLLYTDFGRDVDRVFFVESFRVGVGGGASLRTREQVAPVVTARPWGWWITGIAAAVLIAGGLCFSGKLGTLRIQGPAQVEPAAAATATIARISGSVQLVGPRGARTAGPGVMLQAGDRLTVGDAGSLIEVRYSDGARLQMRQNSEVVFRPEGGAFFYSTRANARAEILVSKGGLAADVPRLPGKREVFATPHAEIMVVGTRFTITAMVDASRVDMLEGQVEVWNRGTQEAVDLPAGRYAVLGAQAAVGDRPAAQASAGRGTRTRQGLQVLYTFREGKGDIIRDLSGVGTPLNLRIRDAAAVRWLPGAGLALPASNMIRSQQPARKIVQACRQTEELTIEAWLRPLRVDQQGIARILTCSQNTGLARNFSLGMEYRYAPWGASYVTRMRSTVAEGEGGYPEIYTLRDLVTTRLTHVVFCRDRHDKLLFYVNGVDQYGAITYGDQHTFYAQRRETGGRFSNWDPRLPLVLGNELTGDRPWLGELHLVAVYNRALSPAEIRQNYQAGPQAE